MFWGTNLNIRQKKFGSNSFTVSGRVYTYQDTKQEYFQISATGFDNEDPSQRYFVNGLQTTRCKWESRIDIVMCRKVKLPYADKYLI
jgi:hypothetical protein